MPSIPLNKLFSDPRNANVCPPEVLEKITCNIKRTGYCPPLIIRPHPKKKGSYIIIDGHHRKHVLNSLGWTEVECQIWDISEKEAQIALATLNRLHGEDNPRKRAELLESLVQSFPLEDLAKILPETPAQIQDYLALLQFDFTEIEKSFEKQIEHEKTVLPVPFTFMVGADKAPIVEAALGLFNQEPQKDRGEILVALCEKVLGDGHGKA
jgi:ParB/RepB/Spo0J family partition protein